MKELEKYITDENTGLKYELVGDYYFFSPGMTSRRNTVPSEYGDSAITNISVVTNELFCQACKLAVS